MTRFTLASASTDYGKVREDLRRAEIALKDQVKAVAAMRRKLPADTPVAADYVFKEGPADLSIDDPATFKDVRLSELFADPAKPLMIIHYMWAPADEAACPMCTMWADGYDAVAPHVRQRANVALVAKQEIAKLRDFARNRGWPNLRLLSSQDTSFNADFGMEDGDGNQMPGVSVFTRGGDGTVRHYYTGGAMMGDDNYNGMDMLNPVWNLLDLLPEGRGDWMPGLAYG